MESPPADLVRATIQPRSSRAAEAGLETLAMLVDQAELNDHGGILTYQLGNTGRRLDAMLTGRSGSSAENAVVVELRRSDGRGPSTDDRGFLCLVSVYSN